MSRNDLQGFSQTFYVGAEKQNKTKHIKMNVLKNMT